MNLYLHYNIVGPKRIEENISGMATMEWWKATWACRSNIGWWIWTCWGNAVCSSGTTLRSGAVADLGNKLGGTYLIIFHP
jgi:hypothetical protein